MSGLVRTVYLGCVFLATLVLAVVSWHDAALQYWRLHAMEDIADGNGVPSLFARDPLVRIGLALVHVENGSVGSAEMASLAADARTALRVDPVNPAALYILAMASERFHPGSGIPLLTLAERESRRLIYTQLALESLLAAKGDLAGAVAHIDDLIEVAPDMSVGIFTAIDPALPDPSLRAAFARYADRWWYGYLVKSAVENGVDIATVKDLLHTSQRSIDPDMKATIYAILIRRVVAEKDFDAARQFAAQLPAKDQRTIADFGLSQASTDPQLSVLGWTLVNDATTSAAIGNDGTLAITVGAEQSQMVASRTTLLSPGDYTLTQSVGHDQASPRAGLIWDLVCAGSPDMSLWHQHMPDGGGETETYQVIITIPSDCSAQDWRLTALGATGQVASTVTLGNLRLQRK
jgi:hypothetical protein